MKTLTWQEAYSNMILDDFVEDKIRDLENAKEYRKLNYIEGKNDPEENKKKPAGAGIRVIESEEYKKLADCPYLKAKADWYNSEEDLNKYGENPFNIKITNRCNQLLLSLRDSWFPNEEDPMPVEDFIYVICCSLIYNKPKKKK